MLSLRSPLKRCLKWNDIAASIDRMANTSITISEDGQITVRFLEGTEVDL